MPLTRVLSAASFGRSSGRGIGSVIVASSFAEAGDESQRAIREMRPRMAKAVLPSSEKRQYWPELGACLDAARRDVGWTVDQLAAELQRDSKQVARWMRGEERTQVDAVFCVEALRAPFVVALAKLAKCFQIETVIRRAG